MEKALRTILATDPGVITAVSGRIVWGRRPQEKAALPAVVLTRIYGRRDHSTAGATGLVESGVQVDCDALTYEAAKGAARAIVAAVGGKDFTESGVRFQRISVEGERDSNGEDTGGRHLFRTSLDLTIWHDE